MLSVQNLEATRGDRIVFTGLSASLAPGSCLIVRGENGSGKTTLLKILAGLLPASEGEVLFDNAPIGEDYRNRMSYVGHKDGLKPMFTVEEYLRHWAALYDGKELIPAAIAFLRMQPMLEQKVSALSAGWKRRLALSQLILAQTDIWLLDEPLSHLDETSMEIILSLIATRCDQGGIVAFSYHGAAKIPFGQVLKMEDFTA